MLPLPEPVPPAEPVPEPDAPVLPAPAPDPPVPLPPMPLPPGDELVPLPPEVALGPDEPPAAAPAPDVTFSSCRHFSRSVPVIARHLLLVLLLAPADAPVELLPAALGVELVLPAVLGVELLPEVLPEALGVELVPPYEEPELCAIETLANARNAAAVAALRIFNVIPALPPYLVVLLPDPLLEPEPMPDPLLPEPEPPLGCLGALLGEAPLPEAPLLGVLLLAPPLVPPAAAPELDLKYASHS